MKKRKWKRGMALLLALFLLSEAVPLRAEQNTKRTKGYHDLSAYMPKEQKREQVEGVRPRRRTNIPAQWDSREKGWITSVKDQGSTGCCWAFGTLASSEASSVLEKEESLLFDLSEWQLAYFMYRRIVDPLGLTRGDENYLVDGSRKVTDNRIYDWGGNNALSLLCLAQGISPALEETAAFEELLEKREQRQDASLPEEAAYQGYRLEKGVMVNPEDKDAVKKAIMEYGAGVGSVYMGSNYSRWWDSTHHSYYCPPGKTPESDHAVTLVGWDDNYSKENFRGSTYRPASDGAWLVKNSWGEKWGDDGYFWLSYEDGVLSDSEEGITFYDITKMEKGEAIYQYDGTCNLKYLLGEMSSIEKQANVFTAQADGRLEKVGFFTLDDNVFYTVKVYRGEAVAEGNPEGTQNAVASAEGSLENKGYFTVGLDVPVELQKEDKFSIVVSLETEDADGDVIYANVPYDGDADYGWYGTTGSSRAGESYICQNGRWKDVGASSGGESYNLRIKGIVSAGESEEEKEDPVIPPEEDDSDPVTPPEEEPDVPPEETEVAIDRVNFPDDAFRSRVRDFDLDGSGGLSQEETDAVTALDVSLEEISDLAGIEHFANLTELNCGYNQLTELDVSRNEALETLYCSNNQLTKLDVSNNAELIYLDCDSNQLTELDVSYNGMLTALYCADNQLVSLDVRNNGVLETLSCWGNQLAELDVSHNAGLTYLDCDSNQLTELDVSYNGMLTALYCADNQLVSLDVKNNGVLETLFCWGNQLAGLDVSQNEALVTLYCSDNQLTELDVSNNAELIYLGCENNQLTNLDVSNNENLGELFCAGNQRRVRVSEGNEFDLSELPDFDRAKAENWENGTVTEEGILIFHQEKVTYDYHVRNNETMNVTLIADNYEEESDPVIPPEEETDVPPEEDDSIPEPPSEEETDVPPKGDDSTPAPPSGEDDLDSVMPQNQDAPEQRKPQNFVAPPGSTVAQESDVVSVSPGTTVTNAATNAVYRIAGRTESGLYAIYVRPIKKNIKISRVPASIRIKGVSYKVAAVAKNAYKGQKKLKKVIIGSNVKTIGKKAFYGCSSLKKVIIKTKKLKKVGAKAFVGVNKKISVTVPAGKKKAYKKILKKRTGL